MLLPDRTFAGLTAVQVRNIMRRLGEMASEERLARLMEWPRARAREVLDELVSAGLYAPTDGSSLLRSSAPFTVTPLGAQLAQASAAPRLQRKTVDRRLRELVDRLVQVNTRDEFLEGIQFACVFGSYITDVDTLGDLDVSITFYRKDAHNFIEQCRKSARESGRRFDSYFEELYWPQTQVKQFLKQRSRVYSIHVDEPILSDPSIARLVIFDERRPVPFDANRRPRSG